MIQSTFKNVCGIVIAITFTIASFAQSMSPVSYSGTPRRVRIGDRMPDAIFKNLTNYPEKNPRVGDFKGKLLLLDFWSTGCPSCIAAFPKMEKLQEQFNGKLQIILVNASETDAQVAERMKTRRYGGAAFKMPALASATGDSTWKEFFPYITVPQHVWINQDGIVIAIASGWNTTAEHIQTVLDGKKLDLILKDDVSAANMLENGAIVSAVPEAPLYYSVFLPHTSVIAMAGAKIDSTKGTRRMFINNSDVFSFFRKAFLKGKDHEHIMYELKDKARFHGTADRNTQDAYSRNYLFCYESLSPLGSDPDEWLLGLQLDANRFFGQKFGIKGVMEKKSMPCWVLKRMNKVPWKTDKTAASGAAINKNGDFQFANFAFLDIVKIFRSSFQDMTAPIAFIDESGITDFDLMMDLIIAGNRMSDPEVVNKALKPYGFELMKESRVLDMLVIKDK